jgi:uncharacterized phiE125 gp8 family phage protein
VWSPEDIERRLFVVTAPEDEPLTVEQAKKQTRVEHDADDEWFQNELIPTVRARAEQTSWRQLILATYDLKLDRFPGGRRIELPRPPLQSVTFVKYLDPTGTEQTLASSTYRVTAPTGERCARGRIALVTGATWPVTADEIDAVTIRFVAGYGETGDEVPARLRMAMLADLATLYLKREDVVIGRPVTMTQIVKQEYKAFRSIPSP